MSKAPIYFLGATAVVALSATVLQAQSNLWDDLDAVIETEAVISTETASSSPFTFSALIYGAFATANQSDARFSRGGTGLDETGVELTFGYDRQLSDRLRLKSELVLEARDVRRQPSADKLRYRLGETYLHFDAGEATWLRFGNLIVPYGTSDAFEILNVFNPRRDELWGLDHPNGKTLSTPAAQFVTVAGDFKFQLAVGAQFEGDRVASAYQDHDYLIRDRAGTVINERTKPDSYDPEWVGSVSYFGEGLDLSFVLGEVYAKQAVLSGVGVGVGGGGLLLETDFPRYMFAGVSGATTFGSWLVRGDLGYFRDQKFFNQGFYANPVANPGSLTRDVVRGAIGLEYTGLSNTILSLELNRNVILDWDSGMRADRISNSIALNAQFSLLDDRLGLDFTIASLANNDAMFLSAKADFAVNDNNSISMQWIDYKSNDPSGFIEPYQDADRIFVGWVTNF